MFEDKPGFRYHPQIVQRFPQICGGVLLVRSLQNGPTPDDLLKACLSEQKKVLEKIGETPLNELPSLAAWRSAFRSFGVDPTKYRSAAEALLRRLTKKGDIPSINTLVDLCNLVSIRYALPVAAFDTRALSGPITVGFASGREAFTAHDTPEPEHPEAGEVIFVDPASLVVARRWCWKQSAESTAQLDTTTAILTVEAQHVGGRNDIESALTDLQVLVKEYANGSFTAGVIDAGRPGLEDAGS
jgi:DNA/RNA-binding domain of Phe-tRNA-synthetase-like protein